MVCPKLAVVLVVVALVPVFASIESLDGVPVGETRGYYERAHSLVKPYQGSGVNIPFWDFGGSTIVTNEYVRLTPDDKSRNGILWNTIPVNSRDWELVISFAVHGSTGHLFGDGLAIWYTKDRGEIGPVFGNKDYFTGLGVFLDTYSNFQGEHSHAHPYISAMVSNGSLHYDHDYDGTHTQLGDQGCTAKFRNRQHETLVLIQYVDDTVSVYTDIDNKKTWSLCFSVPGVSLPTGYYFGMSAATGDLSDNHDIITVKMYEIEYTRAEKEKDVDRSKISPEAAHVAAPRDHIDSHPPPSRLSGFKTGLLVIFGLGVVAVFVIVGVIFVQKQQESSRKRFY